MPAASRIARCRETTERSTSQHSPISLTLHDLAHLARHAKSRNRVASESARNNSGASNASKCDTRPTACNGVAGGVALFLPDFLLPLRFIVCILVQVYIYESGKSTCASPAQKHTRVPESTRVDHLKLSRIRTYSNSLKFLMESARPGTFDKAPSLVIRSACALNLLTAESIWGLNSAISFVFMSAGAALNVAT